jgi:UDP-N-acetylmuramate dehydrogenase
MKGFRVGGARVSEVHANFIVHDGKATTLDVLTLIEQIKEKVLREAAVELVEEVRQWA